MRTLNQCITCIFMVMGVTENYILKHHTGFYSGRNSYIFVYTFTNLYPVTQYSVIAID